MWKKLEDQLKSSNVQLKKVPGKRTAKIVEVTQKTMQENLRNEGSESLNPLLLMLILQKKNLKLEKIQ